MKEKDQRFDSKGKAMKIHLINFINSIDYMNKYISSKDIEINSEIIDKYINLENYINELNIRLEEKKIYIRDIKELYK